MIANTTSKLITQADASSAELFPAPSARLALGLEQISSDSTQFNNDNKKQPKT